MSLRTQRAGSTLARVALVSMLLLANAVVLGAFASADRRVVLSLVAILAVAPAVWLGLWLVERPQRGVVALAALVPFDGLRQLWPIPAGWKEGLVLVTLAATFMAPPASRGPAGRRLPDWGIALGALVAVGAASAIVVGGSQGALGLKIAFFYVLVAWTIWRCPFTRLDRDHLVSVLMLTGVATAVYGVVQQILGPERLVELGYSYERSVLTADGGYFRSFSTFLTNFPFALYLMLVLLVGLAVALDDVRRSRNRWFLVAGVPVILLGLVVSLTRSAWVGLLVGTLYLGLTRYRVLLVALAQIVVVGAIALVFAGGWGGAFLSEESSQDRLGIWTDSLAEVAAHPLGLGIGATGSTAEKLELESGGDVSNALQADNYFLETALELGIIGLWLFIVVLLLSWQAAVRTSRDLAGEEAAFASGVGAMVVASVAVSMSSAYFEVFPLDVAFWLLLGVLATIAPMKQPKRAREGADLARSSR
jgi:hypothetical protein